jgi:hypothetical protein
MRKYGQGCGTAYALDLVGDRWALLVVRELVLGPKRFTDLRDGLPGIGPNVLSQRLKELEEVFWAGVDDGALRVGRGEATEPDAVLTVANVESVAKLMRGELKPAAALRSGAVRVDGDRAAFDRFLSLFRFPPSP